MRQLSKTCHTLSVLVCLLSVLTLALADPAPRPDQRPLQDSPFSPTGDADLGLPTGYGDSQSPPRGGNNGKTSYREENWRHKTLLADGAVIPDSSAAAHDVSGRDIGNSRFGSGNPRLRLKPFSSDSSPSAGKNSAVGPTSTTANIPSLPKPLQMSPIADGNKNASYYSYNNNNNKNLNSSITGHSETAEAVSLPHRREDRMYGDAPAGITVEKPGSANSSTGRNSNGDMTVYPSPRKEFYQDDIQLGCRELRARRYITDGFCTSEDPIKEVVCAGSCLPIKEIPWYAEFIKTIGKNKLREYQCVDDFTRRKRVRLLCQDGSIRTYRIKVVKSCRCERVGSRGNRTSPSKRRRKGKRRKGKDKNKNNRDKKKRNRRRRRRKNKKSSKARTRGSDKDALASNHLVAKSAGDRARSKPKKQSGS